MRNHVDGGRQRDAGGSPQGLGREAEVVAGEQAPDTGEKRGIETAGGEPQRAAGRGRALGGAPQLFTELVATSAREPAHGVEGRRGAGLPQYVVVHPRAPSESSGPIANPLAIIGPPTAVRNAGTDRDRLAPGRCRPRTPAAAAFSREAGVQPDDAAGRNAEAPILVNLNVHL